MQQLEVGAVLEGKVTGITKFGAFVELPGGKTGMVPYLRGGAHLCEGNPGLCDGEPDAQGQGVSIGDDGRVSLSIKKAMEQPRGTARRRPAVSPGRPGGFEWQSKSNESGSFEDMMSRFKQTSDEKMLDLKRSRDGKHGGFFPAAAVAAANRKTAEW